MGKLGGRHFGNLFLLRIAHPIDRRFRSLRLGGCFKPGNGAAWKNGGHERK